MCLITNSELVIIDIYRQVFLVKIHYKKRLTFYIYVVKYKKDIKGA